jgi:hypothetical protein
MKFMLTIAAAATSVALLATPASAAVTFDAGTGAGFVGKGDVQTALGWNNKQLQDNADDAEFTFVATSVAETTWTCDRDAGPQTQERANTTTTSTQGVVDAVTRDKKQVTGFTLLGFEGEPTEETATDGPAVGSCPTGWSAIDLVEGEPVVTSGGLFVNGVALQ